MIGVQVVQIKTYVNYESKEEKSKTKLVNRRHRISSVQPT